MTLTDIENELNKLSQQLDDAYEKSEPLILIEDVRLNDALKTQLQLQLLWENITKKLCWLYDVAEEHTETAYAEAFKNEMKNTYVDVSTTEGREYAKANPAYRDARKLMIEVRHVRDEAKGILETVISRKYILNNLTNAKVASVDKDIL